MTTNTVEATQFMKIILDWCSPQVARSMMDDLDFYVADTTDNESVKESIKMVRQMIYSMAEENLIDAKREPCPIKCGPCCIHWISSNEE